jgi:hypothetical protein
MLNSELLPAPFGPIKPKQEQWSNENDMSSATTTAP